MYHKCIIVVLHNFNTREPLIRRPTYTNSYHLTLTL